MNQARTIAKNTFFLVTSDILGKIVGFFFMVMIIRYLTPEKYGVLSFAFAFVSILMILNDFGLKSLMIREIAREKDKAPKFLGNFIFLKIFISGFMLIATVLILYILDYPIETLWVVFFISLLQVFMGFIQVFNAVFLGYEKMHFQSFGNLIYYMILLCLGFYVVRIDGGVVSIAFIHAIVAFIILIYSAIICLKFFVRPDFQIDKKFIFENLKRAFPFGLALAFVSIFYWVDSVMLSLMKGDEVVGWYNASYRLVLTLLLIPSAYISAIYPVTSRMFVNNRDGLKLAFEKSFQYLTILGVPIGVGTTVLAPKIILFFFGENYFNSIFSLQILVWSSVAIFMSFSFANLFNSLNKQVVVTKIAGIAVLVNILLNLVLIPRYSLYGAAFTTVVTEILTLVLNILYSNNIGYSFFHRGQFVFLFKILIANMGMGLLIIQLNDLNMFLVSVIGTLFYLVLVILLGILDKADFLILKSIISKTK